MQLHLAFGSQTARHYYSTFLDGEGKIGAEDKNSKDHCETIEDLIKLINSRSEIIKHYSKDDFEITLSLKESK